MKAIFLDNDINVINMVYPESTVKKIENAIDTDKDIYTKEMVLENAEIFKDTEYIFSTWGMPVFTDAEVKEYFPKLKCVFYAAGSVQAFARPFMNNGVKVFSAWAANAVPVAEYTVAQIILANKGFYATSRIFKGKKHSVAREWSCKYLGNYNAKIGIIGAGMIGKLVINMLKAYNLDVMVFDPFLPEDVAIELGVEKASLERIFTECNVVSNHLADNEKTKNMLDYNLFALMPENATFINTGRGAQVVEADLIRLLNERKDITAVLDVTMPEPPLEDSELYTLENCILTPHIAGSSGNEVQRMSEYMAEEFEKYIKNIPCEYEVTYKMLETMA